MWLRVYSNDLSVVDSNAMQQQHDLQVKPQPCGGSHLVDINWYVSRAFRGLRFLGLWPTTLSLPRG